MNMKDNNNEIYNKEEEEGIDIQAILMMFFSHWKWFVVSVVACLLVAFAYLRYPSPLSLS